MTIGFGYELFDALGLADRRPTGLSRLPAFAQIDALEDRYSGGDLLLQICSDDALTVAHAQRMLLKDTRAFAAPRWFQRGFLPAPVEGTPRNLMGQVDGTVNPSTDDERDDVVWARGPGWFAGGTTLVLRRVRMDLDRWDQLDRSAMETVIGRRLGDGAPLTGGAEHDDPDFSALDATGLPAIADFAHIRLAHGDGPNAPILRRPYNFDDSPAPDGSSDLGQVFCSFQADIAGQFVPVQERIANGDLLNQWVTPVGSAVRTWYLMVSVPSSTAAAICWPNFRSKAPQTGHSGSSYTSRTIPPVPIATAPAGVSEAAAFELPYPSPTGVDSSLDRTSPNTTSAPTRSTASNPISVSGLGPWRRAAAVGLRRRGGWGTPERGWTGLLRDERGPEAMRRLLLRLC